MKKSQVTIPKERRDSYVGIPRIWRGNRIYTGLVSCKSMTGRNCRISVSIWEVRENGKTVLRVSSGTGLSTKTKQFAVEVAKRNGLYEES